MWGVEFLESAEGHTVSFLLASRGYGVDQTIWRVVSSFPNDIWAGQGGVGPSSTSPGPVSQGQVSHVEVQNIPYR